MANLNQARPTLTFSVAVETVLKKYVTFTGRARRSEYWFFVLFNVIVSVVAGILDFLFGLGGMVFGKFGVFTALVTLALLLPSLAVVIRRLHDINRSGWWILPVYVLTFIGQLGIPVVSVGLSALGTVYGLCLLFWLCRDSDRETNKYGASPKYGTLEEVIFDE